jgi:hypothetical protein
MTLHTHKLSYAHPFECTHMYAYLTLFIESVCFCAIALLMSF